MSSVTCQPSRVPGSRFSAAGGSSATRDRSKDRSRFEQREERLAAQRALCASLDFRDGTQHGWLLTGEGGGAARMEFVVLCA